MKNKKVSKIFKSFCKKEWGLGGEGKKLVSTRFFPRHQILKLLLWLIAFGAAGVIGVVLFVCYCNYAVRSCGEYCYSDMGKLPVSETALVPGTAKTTAGGWPNLYFEGRVDAAAKLYHVGKIKKILISGDNSRKDYDEPTDMKNALIERGVPENVITLDYAGFRTLDTVVRAKNVFGKKKFLVITQWGHAERAVYIARKHGVEAYGFYAAEPNHIPWLVKKNRSREVLAAVAAWLDVNILRKQPKFSVLPFPGTPRLRSNMLKKSVLWTKKNKSSRIFAQIKTPCSPCPRLVNYSRSFAG